jgi:hypothetical protein
MPSDFTLHEMEEQIRNEFQFALDELEVASGEENAEATDRLNRATRRLYDFVGSGKVPQDLPLKRFRE